MAPAQSKDGVFQRASILPRTRGKVHRASIVTEPILIAWPINVRPGPEADSCAAANFSSWFMLGKRLPEGWRAADELGEPSRGIGMSGSTIQQVSSVPAYCKASRSVDCAFGSAICRANPLGCQNLLFPVYRARTGLRALWVRQFAPFSLSCTRQDETRLTFGLRISRGPFLFAAFCESSLSSTIFFPTRQSYIADL